MQDAVRPALCRIRSDNPASACRATTATAPIKIRWNLASGASAVPTFEESLKKLESIVDQLEKGDLPLEESLKLFEEGVSLSAICKKELDEAEGKVQTLIKQRDGSFRTEPFPTDKSS